MAIIRDLEELSNDINTARNTFFSEYKFGYLSEVNASHNTDYPLMVLTPPMSRFENPYSNDEDFTLRFYLYDGLMVEADDLGTPTLNQNATQMLERTFDKIYNAFIGSMDALLKNNEHKYIMQGGWEIERISEVHNDRLVGLIITIRLQKFSHCLKYSTKH